MAGGAGGSILAMIQSYRNNMSMLRHSAFNKPNRTFLNSKQDGSTMPHIKLEFVKASEEELSAFRLKLAKKRKKLRIINTLILTPFLVLFAFLIIKLVSVVVDVDYDYSEDPEFKNAVRMKNEKYWHFVEEGDHWLNLGHWHNAIWQYEIAEKVYPTRFPARAGIARAMTFRCIQDTILCYQTKIYLDIFVSDFPTNYEAYEIRGNYRIAIGQTEEAQADFAKIEKLLESQKLD